jgi:uncharacterized protein (TIGR02452 family)
MGVTRSAAARMGKEISEILAAGAYDGPRGRVAIADAVARARATTVSYPPDAAVAPPAPRGTSTRFEVVNGTTLAAARRLAAEGKRPVALNFASAKRPGGGFLSGAIAQEESIARASALFACLDRQPMYAHHRAQGDPMYTAWAIYSPDVLILRDEDGELLAEPWPCAFITAPAPNAKVILERDAARRPAIRAELVVRIARVLSIAALHDHPSLVLGAWGCGVFGNDPEEVAGLLHAALHGPFQGAFEEIVFAVLDRTEEARFVGPFARRFGVTAAGA